MLAKDAGKRDAWEMDSRHCSLKRRCLSHASLTPHTIHGRMCTEIFSPAFFGPVAELARSKVQDGKNNTQTADGLHYSEIDPSKIVCNFFVCMGRRRRTARDSHSVRSSAFAQFQWLTVCRRV